jgi:hypothetical protein
LKESAVYAAFWAISSTLPCSRQMRQVAFQGLATTQMPWRALRGNRRAVPHLASAWAHSMQLLLQAGADINAIDERCYWPIHYAIDLNCTRTILLLIDGEYALPYEAPGGELLPLMAHKNLNDLMRSGCFRGATLAAISAPEHTSGPSPNWLTMPMTLRRCTLIALITLGRCRLITPVRFAYGRCTTIRDARL